MLDLQRVEKFVKYPEPGSNRHGLPHWCLRPARLPIPPSGLGIKTAAKVQQFAETRGNAGVFFE